VKPRLFIGSSVEGVSIARNVEALLQHTIDCIVWPNAFPLAQNTIDSLVTEFEKADFGLFVLSPEAHPVVPGSSTYRGGGPNLKRGWVSSFRVP
jgi:predicted nucleotide-binding protein